MKQSLSYSVLLTVCLGFSVASTASVAGSNLPDCPDNFPSADTFTGGGKGVLVFQDDTVPDRAGLVTMICATQGTDVYYKDDGRKDGLVFRNVSEAWRCITYSTGVAAGTDGNGNLNLAVAFPHFRAGSAMVNTCFADPAP